jgi:hypothetical protein
MILNNFSNISRGPRKEETIFKIGASMSSRTSSRNFKNSSKKVQRIRKISSSKSSSRRIHIKTK